ncbi:hypothetical protein KIL84_005899 [Mauremys mutica]|uniref:Uncharacterized protein n=1 Tax=Mauremys mutica TaxID=74926 RepID=A0A9D4B459_9SAUR|nr:hypothetical protein KIL84_005899 [Mauremys mutica]
MCSSPDNAVVGATGTPSPEQPKNQESALRPLTTPIQHSTRVQVKPQDSPHLLYVKPKDKTKDCGKNQPSKYISSSSVATTTPSPEKTVSENAHIHTPRTRALGVVNKKTRTDKPFSQHHKLITAPTYACISEK